MDLKLLLRNKEEDPASFEQAYEGLIESLVRKKYTLGQELAVLRKRDVEPDEFRAYYEYVEKCKIDVKVMLGLL